MCFIVFSPHNVTRFEGSKETKTFDQYEQLLSPGAELCVVADHQVVQSAAARREKTKKQKLF